MPAGRNWPITPDYDADPDRFRTGRQVLRRFARADDVHPRIAGRLRDEARAPVLDIGCGEGQLARYLPEGWWVGIDTSPTMLAAAPAPAFIADATHIPFPDDHFGGVALLHVLHHLAEPRNALVEAHRVLEPGGLLALAATSRHDSPELVGSLFDWVEVESSDMTLIVWARAATV